MVYYVGYIFPDDDIEGFAVPIAAMIATVETIEKKTGKTVIRMFADNGLIFATGVASTPDQLEIPPLIDGIERRGPTLLES